VPSLEVVVIPRFSLTRAASLSDAVAAFRAANGDAAYLAGGTELLQVMKMGLAEFRTLIDIKAIPELCGIKRAAGGEIVIGATTTHREIERSSIVRSEVPALASLAAVIANVRVRNTGTLGGNLTFAEPHSDPATFLLACGARVVMVGGEGRRELPIDEFIAGPLQTSREPDEVLVEVRIPAPQRGEGRAYRRIAFFERPTASVAVRMVVSGGAIELATVTVGSVTDAPLIVTVAGEALTGVAAEPESMDGPIRHAAEAFAGLDLIGDLSGSSEYKRHLASVLFGDACRAAVREAQARA
jgi:aerobic carbon-monoxide dehydrogenase medium subunit